MIDLHTHTLFSDGELLPSELARRAQVKGYTAIALTDHVDSSNIDFVIPRIVKACVVINRCWDITAIPGAEITHAPLEEIKRLVKSARRFGARVVVVHGETLSEPVVPGTNRCAIESGCDILAHPGMISEEDVRLAGEKGVFLEITTRKNHRSSNKRLVKLADSLGAGMVLNTDSHCDKDLISDEKARTFLSDLGLKRSSIGRIFRNSKMIVDRVRR
jgi:histidinol phosphatase-like PHP family hydrolase